MNNAQNIVALPDRKANRFAGSLGYTKFVGADSHMDASIAPCYQLMVDFDGPAEFLEALRMAELRVGRHPLWYFAAAGYRTLRYLAGLPLPSGFGANHQTGPAIQPPPMTVSPS